MSRQRSLEQERAKTAWNAIEKVKQGSAQFAKEYSSLARGAPADVQANGLGQTLAFWRAKGYEQGTAKQNNAYAELLKHVADWLRAQKILPQSKDPVEWISKEATTEEYRRASAESIAFLIWLRRFAEAELPKGEGG